jgi:UDP-glucose 4-epimerase
MIEQVLSDLDASDEFRSISLRYFNAAGADPSGVIGESHVPETHLIPLVIRAVLEDSYTIGIFGTDYNTPDGTCIRDYIHVNDLASAHILALENLLKENRTKVFNLGNGKGFSVREVIESVRRISGKKPRSREMPRREGDPDVLVASSDKAQKELGWKPQMAELDTIVETAWRWERSGKRKGY